MYAFRLEECGLSAAAEDEGRAAVAADARAIHAVARVY
jgi:hypothetical protein